MKRKPKQEIKQLGAEFYEDVYNLIKQIDDAKNVEKDIKKGFFFGLFVGDILVGVYSYKRYKKHLQLTEMFIKQPYRNKGYGKQLLEHFESQGKEMGYSCFKVYTAPEYKTAYPFYCKCGYILIIVDEYENLLFEKRIKND